MSSIPRERRRRLRRRVLRNRDVDAEDQTLATRWSEEHWRKTRYGLFYFSIGLFGALTTLISIGLNTFTIIVWALLPFLVALNLVGLSFGFLDRRWLRDHRTPTSEARRAESRPDLPPSVRCGHACVIRSEVPERHGSSLGIDRLRRVERSSVGRGTHRRIGGDDIDPVPALGKPVRQRMRL